MGSRGMGVVFAFLVVAVSVAGVGAEDLGATAFGVQATTVRGPACDMDAVVGTYHTLHGLVREVVDWLAAATAPLTYGSEPGVTERLALVVRGQQVATLLRVAEALRLYACASFCAPGRCGLASASLELKPLEPDVYIPGIVTEHLTVFAKSNAAKMAAALRGGGGDAHRVGTRATLQQGVLALKLAIVAVRLFWKKWERAYAVKLTYDSMPSAFESLLEIGRLDGDTSAALEETPMAMQPPGLPAFAMCGRLPAPAPLRREPATRLWKTDWPASGEAVRQLLLSADRVGGGLSFFVIAIRPPPDLFNETCRPRSGAPWMRSEGRRNDQNFGTRVDAGALFDVGAAELAAVGPGDAVGDDNATAMGGADDALGLEEAGAVPGLDQEFLTDVTKCLQEEGGWSMHIEFVFPDGRTDKLAQWHAGHGEPIQVFMPTDSTTMQSMPYPFADLVRLSPLVGNCALLEEQLFTKGAQVLPRVVLVPINPLIPPPFEVIPDFGAVFRDFKHAWESAPLGALARLGIQGQCSLAAVQRVLSRFHPYRLERIEPGRPYAIFVYEPLATAPIDGEVCDEAAAGDAADGAPAAQGAHSWTCRSQALFEAWAHGWLCNAEARYAQFLEVYPNSQAWMDLADLEVAPARKTKRLCDIFAMLRIPISRANFDCGAGLAPPQQAPGLMSMLAAAQFRATPGVAAALGSNGHGNCPSARLGGACECFPPWRGRLCDVRDSRELEASRPFGAAVVTAVPDREDFIAEFASNLALFWERFNKWHDYPVLVFSEGLRGDTRRWLVSASPCRLWFFAVDELTEPPAHAADLRSNATLWHAQHKSLGYRAQARWKAGPMFHHPVFAAGTRFQYIWWQDYDSYLPRENREDPFLRMHERGLAFGWTHWGVDARASARHFWEYARLYMREVGVGPQDTHLLRELHSAGKEGGFYRQRVILNDNELLRVDWFAAPPYQRFFAYIDKLQGMWLFRWGDHLVRTFGVAMLLPDSRWEQLLELPYAHQEVCICGGGDNGARMVAGCERVEDLTRPRKSWRWHCGVSAPAAPAF